MKTRLERSKSKRAAVKKTATKKAAKAALSKKAKRTPEKGGLKTRRASTSAPPPDNVVQIGRVSAMVRKGGEDYRQLRAVLLCRLQTNSSIADGEWMGYVRSPWGVYPFLLKKAGEAELIFEGNEGFGRPTNLGHRLMTPGTLFTLLIPEDDPGVEEMVFEVTSCHRYA